MTQQPRLLRADNPADVLTAARMLRDGRIVVIPTDTVYGLAASIFRPQAIERVFVAKGRSPQAQVPVLMASAADLSLLARDVPPLAWKLINRFWPGPLTLVLPARPSVATGITRGGATVATRVPGARSCLSLLEALGEPTVGTSANISGSPPATSAKEALDQLGGRVDAVLADDAAISTRQASTVVEILGDKWHLHRAGAVTTSDLLDALGTMPVYH